MKTIKYIFAAIGFRRIDESKRAMDWAWRESYYGVTEVK